MSIQTTHLERSLQTLEASLKALTKAPPDSIDFEIYRNAVIKGFELTLEVSGNLLRKALKIYGYSAKEIDTWPYKEVFRHATKHGLLSNDTEIIAIILVMIMALPLPKKRLRYYPIFLQMFRSLLIA